MSTLFYTAKALDTGQSDTLANVRSTVTTVTDDDASVATTVPDSHVIETDPTTDGGLTTHQVASKVNASDQYAPYTVNARSDHNDNTNSAWSNVGTAAMRESAGEWGHGTAYSQDAMSRPADGTEFAEEYFERDHRGMNADVGDYMTPSVADVGDLDDISETGKALSRKQNNVNPYQAMYDSFMGA